MIETETISVRLLKPLLEHVDKLGFDRQQIEQQAHLQNINFNSPDVCIPFKTVILLSQILRERLGPSAAIQLGAYINSSSDFRPSILDYLVESCNNLGQVYRTIERYTKILSEFTSPRLTISNHVATFGYTYSIDLVNQAPDIIEFILTHWLCNGRSLTGCQWVPRQILLQTPGTDIEAYETVFKCPVTHSASQTALIFDADLLELPVLNSDPMLQQYLKPYADRMVDNLPTKHKFVHLVQSHLTETLKDGEPQLQTVASKFNISIRTLQRRLANEGTSFAAVLDETRRIAAFRYLKNQCISVSDIAIMLGFSEPSSFYRAFKRWTDVTPDAYRRSNN